MFLRGRKGLGEFAINLAIVQITKSHGVFVFGSGIHPWAFSVSHIKSWLHSTPSSL